MHEYNFTQCLFENVLIILERNYFPSVKTINLGFGPFANVDFEKMVICWEDLTEGTFLEGSTLNKKDVEGYFFCENCNKEYSFTRDKLEEYYPDQEVFLCPECNSHKTRIISGAEINILSLVLKKESFPM